MEASAHKGQRQDLAIFQRETKHHQKLSCKKAQVRLSLGFPPGTLEARTRGAMPSHCWGKVLAIPEFYSNQILLMCRRRTFAECPYDVPQILPSLIFLKKLLKDVLQWKYGSRSRKRKDVDGSGFKMWFMALNTVSQNVCFGHVRLHLITVSMM